MADSAAFVVLHQFSLDTSHYIFPYVARWAEDKAILKRNLEAVHHSADAIIGGIGTRLVDTAAEAPAQIT